jgi:retron-type reverse transcriptase
MSTRELASYERAYIEKVREQLADIPERAREDAVLYAQTLLERGYPVIFDQTHLAHVSGVPSQLIGAMSAAPPRFYSQFRIGKADGSSRLLHAPTPELKKVQHWIQRHITSRFRIHDAAHGFIAGRSIISNATPHVGADVILKLDLRDFFGTVDRRAVFRAFRFAGYSRHVSGLMTTLTTLNESLPQGAPTSPDLANVAAYRLDVRLSAFADKHSLNYTRYADDLTFSGRFVPAEQRTIESIIRDEGFSPNERKLRYLLPDARQSVTGIVVNEKLNWPRSVRRWLRQEIYYLGRFGVEEHLTRRDITHGRYKEFIYGHVYALHSVRPDEARALLAALDEVDWPY